MAKAKYVCLAACTFRLPGEGYDTYFERNQEVTVDEDVRMPKHFRRLKRAEVVTPEKADTDDPLSAALAGERVPLSAITKQTNPAPLPPVPPAKRK
jgi:hypothetical protein